MDIRIVFCVWLTAVLAVPAAAEPLAELEPAAETALALSAAPAHLRAGAGVYRLGARGYERVRASANGFNCLVAREPSLGLGPVCYDREGSATLLSAALETGRLLREGKTREEIDAFLDGEYRAGRLVAPRRAGIAYMLSTGFSQVSGRTGRRECIFPPHMMFYAPYLRNEDIGADRSHRGSIDHPWILNEGRPDAYILVVSHGANPDDCR